MNITMGNDEFILYIRKYYPACTTSTDTLGRRIWSWIRETDPGAVKTAEHEPCYWGNTGTFIAENRLPKTATQFRFNRAILPDLFTFLDHLGRE